MKSKFNTLLLKVGSEYLLTEEDLQAAPEPSPSGIDEVQQNPSPDEQGQTAPDEPEKLTPEGKRFLIEIALKALSIDPATLTEQDKAIFGQEVTSHNADDVLNQIQQIVEQNT